VTSSKFSPTTQPLNNRVTNWMTVRLDCNMPPDINLNSSLWITPPQQELLSGFCGFYKSKKLRTWYKLRRNESLAACHGGSSYWCRWSKEEERPSEGLYYLSLSNRCMVWCIFWTQPQAISSLESLPKVTYNTPLPHLIRTSRQE
jgi:hypothetical protein